MVQIPPYLSSASVDSLEGVAVCLRRHFRWKPTVGVLAG